MQTKYQVGLPGRVLRRPLWLFATAFVAAMALLIGPALGAPATVYAGLAPTFTDPVCDEQTWTLSAATVAVPNIGGSGHWTIDGANVGGSAAVYPQAPGDTVTVEHIHHQQGLQGTWEHTFANPDCEAPQPPPADPDPGTLTITKVTFDADGAVDSAGTFTFRLDGDTTALGSVAGGGGGTSFSVDEGVYTLTEDPETGWTNLGGEVAVDAQSCATTPPASLPTALTGVTIDEDETTFVCWYNQAIAEVQPTLGLTAQKTQRAGTSGTFVTSPISTAPDGTIQYRITVTNSGEATLDDIAISDSAPAGTTFHSLVDQTGSQCDPTANGIECTDVELAPNTQYVVTFQVTVGDAEECGFSLSNSAQVASEAADASFSTNTVVADGPTCPLAPAGNENGNQNDNQNGNQGDPPPANTQVTVPTPEAVEEPESESQADSLPEILGVSAEITKVLTSSSPAVVGDLVTFDVALTLSGDSTVENVGILETFEHQYLEYVSSTGDCVLLPPAASHSSVACEIGTVELGAPGEPGSQTFVVSLTFRAVSSTLPGVTENRAEGLFGGGSIGPVAATVEIIEVAGLVLPVAGDGSTASSRPNATHAALVIAALLVGAAAVGVRARRTAIRTRLHK